MQGHNLKNRVIDYQKQRPYGVQCASLIFFGWENYNGLVQLQLFHQLLAFLLFSWMPHLMSDAPRASKTFTLGSGCKQNQGKNVHFTRHLSGRIIKKRISQLLNILLNSNLLFQNRLLKVESSPKYSSPKILRNSKQPPSYIFNNCRLICKDHGSDCLYQVAHLDLQLAIGARLE